MFTGVKSELELRLKTAYSAYLTNTAERYGRAKSFFIRSIPTDIYRFYVPMRVISGEAELPKVALNDILSLTTRAILTAPAGAGKTILLRHLFLDALRSSDRIPVFIELRNIDDSSHNLLDVIKRHLVTFGFDLGDMYFQKAMELGHFILLLDGFDEVKSAIRNRLSRQIAQLSRQAPDCVIIVSSRHDDVFSGWQEFTEFSVAPLVVEEACELIERLPFEDDELKGKFVADLRSFLFERHKSFLSNPLLLSIMLLTYGESADIPTKLSLFYNQAYETLFQRHDALKGGYQRERRTSLDIQDFARVFGAFCLQTYDLRRFQFSRSDALECIRKAKTYVGIEVEDVDYLEDCLQSVCLLMEDGLSVVFSHRSFQEYFVAHYVQSADPRIQVELLRRFVASIGTDNVYALLYEMNPGPRRTGVACAETQEDFLATLELKRFVGITHFSRFLKTNFSRVSVSNGTLTFTHRARSSQEFPVVGIVGFAWNRCVAAEHKAFNRELFLAFVKGHPLSGEVEYDLKEISINAPLMRELSVLGGLFSVSGLDSVFRLSRQLERRHARVEASLEELLK